jgi:hypothetical protein
MSTLVGILDAVAWPVAIVGIVVALTSRGGRLLLEPILGRIRRVQALGFGIELDAESARELKVTLEETLEGYRERARREFDRVNRVNEVPQLLADVANTVIAPAIEQTAAEVEREVSAGSPRPSREYHCAVYVPDILLGDALYRLTDYYPRGGGRGKTYSVRFGIIGRAWRLEASQEDGDVPHDPPQLIEKWGMTDAEARVVGHDDRAFIASILRHDDRPVGLVYAEAGRPDAFTQGLANELASDPKAGRLAQAVAAVMHEMRALGPMLKVFEH